MRIAQISPLMEAVPPKLYGGTERIVAYLSDALVAMGHDVTLFASGDSVTTATLAPACPRALRVDPTIRDHIAPLMAMLETVAQRAGEFDIIHLHCDYLGYSALRRTGTPFLATLHGRLDLPELRPLYGVFSNVPVVSISDAQRAPLPQARFIATIPHGLPERLLLPGSGAGGYLAFLGRISPEKRADRAIAIARAAGLPLKIAAKVDRVDEAYFHAEIKALLRQPGVEFIGEIDDRHKNAFLGQARALLFPIDWPEPFGLSMIEAMACGTPVLAYGHGAVPEVVDEGVTGAIVHTMDEATSRVQSVLALDRVQVRRRFEQRFTVARMARDYVEIYKSLIGTPKKRETGVPASGRAMSGNGHGELLTG